MDVHLLPALSRLGMGHMNAIGVDYNEVAGGVDQTVVGQYARFILITLCMGVAALNGLSTVSGSVRVDPGLITRS